MAFLAVAAYAASLDNGFSLDDYNWLARTHFAPSRLAFVFEPEPGEIVSPVAKAFLLAGFGAFGLEPRGWHVVLVLLHALNSILVYLLGGRLLGDRGAALLAGCFFAVAASGSEAIFWMAAYGHPLATALYLTTLLLFLRRLETSSPGPGGNLVAVFVAGLLTKASFYSSSVALAVVPASAGGRRARLLRPLVVLFVAALVLNAAFALNESYLLRRGVYTPGWHMFTNLAELLARIVFPFRAVFDRVGLGATYAWTLDALLIGIPCAAGAIAVFADRGARFGIVFALLAVTPFLPFIYAPTSRYTYLATAGWSWVAAWLVLSIARRWRRRVLVGVAVALFMLAHLCEIVLEDNEYEYREHLMARLVADVREIYVEEPANRTITILQLPNFAIDRGIHLQAALALAYDDSRLILIAPEPGTAVDGEALMYADGRIRRRQPSSTGEERD